MGLRENPEWCGATHLGSRAAKVPFLVKMTKMPLVTLGLTEGQTRSKSTQNNTLHGFTINPSLSEIFNKFDQVWPEVNLEWAQKP